MQLNKKLLLVSVLCAGMIFGQAFAQRHDDDDDKKPTNLKILPKDISNKELHEVMRGFSKSLGVRCNFCHAGELVNGKMKLDFASDDKQEKNTARNMMKMVDAINNNYLGKMIGGDHTLESIKCVTCHMGRKTPIISIDSLAPEAHEGHEGHERRER